MAGAQGPRLLPLWLWCWVQLLLAPRGPRPARAFNLHSARPTVYTGPGRSYFGFALDFVRGSDGRMSVVVGAPRANTSQPGLLEPGAVYVCPWAPGESRCSILEFDPTGNQDERWSSLQLRTYKSGQWFGASVSSWNGLVVACAPLQHWNAFEGTSQATQTPVGTCFVATEGLSHFAEYAPCRSNRMEDDYKHMSDKRYCEVGFSAAITQTGRLVLGAPGGYYFMGLIFSVNLSAVASHAPGKTLLRSVGSEQLTQDSFYDPDTHDSYRGYSVAVGEFDGNPNTPEYVVGVPNRRTTLGAVEIFSARDSLQLLQRIQSNQVASYFGHTVAVADVDGNGKDDVLVGAPLYMERRSDRKLSEVGQVYLYLQRRDGLPVDSPWQTLTGPDVYGRFGTAIAPLGDLDQDGYVDVAVGAPFAGSGRVFIFSGHSEGLRTPATQVLESPFPGHAAFGFSVRGATDIDVNGYPDVLVGAFGAGKVAVYRARPVVVLSSQLSVPNTLNPEEKNCTAPGSGAPVSCFPIELCVSISGKRLPERVRLTAALQLDRLKAKSGRRVWELQTRQTTQHLELQLPRAEPRVCSQLQASLRDEADFKDKLSPIVVSLALSLAVGPGTEELAPVLSGQTAVQEQTRIVVDCGEDNVCVPDLRLAAHTPMSQLFLGAEDVVHILATASNAGEGAFEAELWLQLPRDAHYQRATSNLQGMEKLVCNPKKENETRVVICELGNPMKSGAKVVVDVTLSISNLEEAGDAIEFQLQLRSKNSQSPHSAVQRVQIPIKAAAELDLRGNSLPATMVLPLGGWEQGKGSRRVEDQGPRVEHVYQLHNQGPGTVSRAELRVAIPSRLQDDILLYLTGLSTEGKINCSSHTRFNHLELQLPTAPPSQNTSYQLASRRERREAAEAEADLATLREPTLVDCSSHACVTVRCQVEALARDQRAMVTIHSVLWMQSVRKRPLDQFIIQSQAWFNVSALPYRIQPDTLPSGHATAHTEVMRVSPDAEREIPTRWVVLAVLAGLLLLALFICAMWKMGFFKRTRPPMDEEEELTSEETGEPCTGRGH